MVFYNPARWYWLGTPGLYSSAAGALISTSDSGYMAWLEGGNVASPWPIDATGAETLAALDAVLIAAGLPPTELTAQLLEYANAKVNQLLAVSRTYNLSGPSVRSDTLPTPTGSDLLTLYVLGTASPSATFHWTDNFGTTTSLTGTQIVALGLAVAAYGQSVWAVMATAASGIAAGTITATTEIDALSWPV
jgi:hypothetical protein